MCKILFLTTGAIGSGKTVFSKELLCHLSNYNIEYINTDLYYYCYFNNGAESLSADYRKAKKYCKYKLKQARLNGTNILWEAVAAKQDKLEELREFQKQNYIVIVIFILNSNLDELERQVLKRAQEGCYNVPLDKIASRKSMLENNHEYLARISDIMIDVTIDNNGNVNQIKY